ncbi:hypothetical protein COLO4_19506 [Corchorus olitorius]|uniref:PLAC8 family protein n=1 Tax=Corchorus olitorius TaxID=93759 RepID=A0A1R3J519_9ROSI|nr:hypothetical protein COLO4_19506 [Corchorus olitorius]
MSHRLTYPWDSRTKSFLVLLGMGMANHGSCRRSRSRSLYSGLLESVLAAMTCRAEAPCGDFATHFFCHLCAICQEYREIRERAADSEPPDLKIVVTAPPIQTMESSGPEQ